MSFLNAKVVTFIRVMFMPLILPWAINFLSKLVYLSVFANRLLNVPRMLFIPYFALKIVYAGKMIRLHGKQENPDL